MTDAQIKKREIESALAKIRTGDFFGSAQNLLAVSGLPQPTHAQTIGLGR